MPLSASGPVYQSASFYPQAALGFGGSSAGAFAGGSGVGFPSLPPVVYDVDSLQESYIPTTTLPVNILEELLKNLSWLNSVLVKDQITVQGSMSFGKVQIMN